MDGDLATADHDALAVSDPVDSITIGLHTKRDAATFRARRGETLLFAGLRNGFDLPYECASGTCGTCQAQVLSAADGSLVSLNTQAPGALGIPANRVLMCQTACRGDADLRLFSTLRRFALGNQPPRPLGAELLDIRLIARDTYGVSIATAEKMNYSAGQFAMLSADGVEGARAYSMTAAPSVATSLEFAIRKKPGGSFSKWMDSAKPGDAIRVFGPLGRAVLPDEPRDLFAVVGGTGAAGVLSILEEALVRGDFDKKRATLVFGVRSLSDAFHLEQLAAWVRASAERLRVVVALSDPGSGPAPDCPGVEIVPGLVLNVARRLLQSERVGEACYFLAGPPVVVDGGISMLGEQFKVSSTDIRYDRF